MIHLWVQKVPCLVKGHPALPSPPLFTYLITIWLRPLFCPKHFPALGNQMSNMVDYHLKNDVTIENNSEKTPNVLLFINLILCEFSRLVYFSLYHSHYSHFIKGVLMLDANHGKISASIQEIPMFVSLKNVSIDCVYSKQIFTTKIELLNIITQGTHISGQNIVSSTVKHRQFHLFFSTSCLFIKKLPFKFLFLPVLKPKKLFLRFWSRL